MKAIATYKYVNTIKECPFCRCDGVLIDFEGETRVYCHGCGTLGPNDGTVSDVVNAWNTRPHLSEKQAEASYASQKVEELIEAVKPIELSLKDNSSFDHVLHVYRAAVDDWLSQFQ